MGRREFIALIGCPGCGKTTILNILAVDALDAGTIVTDGRKIAGPALDRAVAFQFHALLPKRRRLAMPHLPPVAATPAHVTAKENAT